MFESLNTDNPKKFRKSLVIELGKFLRDLREQDENLEDQPVWGFMQQIKGNLLDPDIPFVDIINSLPTEKFAHDAIQYCIDELKKVLENPLYEKVLDNGKPVKKSEVLLSSSSSSLFTNKPEKKTESEPQSIGARLLFQLDNIENPAVDKSEAVMMLMQEASPDNYNGYFIDINKEISPRVTIPTESEERDLKIRLQEIENRTNQVLFNLIDKLIEENIASGKNRLHIIVKTGTHYTPIDIDIAEKSCFICDASQDFRRVRMHQIGKYSRYIHPDKVFDAQSPGFEFQGKINHGGELQKTKQGCSIFSVYHSLELAKIDSLHEDILKNSQYDDKTHIRTIEWLRLPPMIVKIGQSTNFLDYYKFMNPQHANEIDRLTNNNEKFYGYNTAIADFKNVLRKINETKSSESIEENLTTFVRHSM